MSVGEGSYHKCLESKYQDSFRQIPADSAKFISSPSQSLTAPSSHYVQSPEQQGIPINYQSHNYNHHPRFNCHPNSGGNFSVSENDSAVQLSADYSNPNPLNDLDFQLMNIDQNMSPSSGITSPMDLGFTNIGDEQSIDNIDLNNITPSIKLASSLTLLGPSDYSSGSGGGNGNPRQQQTTSGSSGGGGTYENEMPSASCPTENSGAAYPATSSGRGPFESPNGALNIPRPANAGGGSGAGNASGGSGASSVTGTWGGGSSLASLSGAPNIAVMQGSNPVASTVAAIAGADNQRVAMMRARSKKDSHNRIERKRRDYINCQITELGNLLPEEMFRENDCKKNKGSILKNSVEYISILQKENQCYNSLYNETNLASTLIERMMKRIQTFESVLPPEYLVKVASEGVGEYRSAWQEWSKVHEMNHQKMAVGGTTGHGVGAAGATGVSVDTSESSPGMSSVGNNEDGSYLDARGDSNSPVPLVGRSGRTRCTSASSSTGQPVGLGVTTGGGALDNGGPLGGPPIVGSLPSRGARILPATSPPNPPGPNQTGSRLHQMRPMFSPSLYASSGGSGVKHPSPPAGSRMTGKRTATGRPPPTKMEESGVGIPVPKQSPIFSPGPGNTFGGSSGGSGPFAGLSISLPVRMAPDEFPNATEMNTDESYLRMTTECGGEPGSGCQDVMTIPAGGFKPEPMVEVPCNPPSTSTPFHSHSYQPPLFCASGPRVSIGMSGTVGGNSGVPPIWPRLQRPVSAGQHQQAPINPTSPGHQPMADELQFDHAM
ncbi:unnamed protein product [Hymenolepis diminuta]|uniref:BHLH domain-containing protein n=1 Tax=Hymenolepis diminuta TaxID=6216 RepID=A0A564YMP9_HYMDI|nr:unnamed protein product [Hymenolepis diminuta]